MQYESSWLDRLTEYVLTISEPSDERRSPKDWIDQTAQTLARRFGPNCGVAVIRAVAGPAKAPWSKSTYAIHCGIPERSTEWRRRYTATVVSSELTPTDYINSAHYDGPSCWMLGESCLQPKIHKMGNLLARQHEVIAFIHCVRAIPGKDGLDAGALILDAWAWGHEPVDAFPPKPVFQNISRAIAANLACIERIQAPKKESLIDRLTPAQRKVAELLLQGLSERQAAEHLERSHHTIHQHVKAIYANISVRTRAEFMARCLPVVKSNTNLQHNYSAVEQNTP